MKNLWTEYCWMFSTKKSQKLKTCKKRTGQYRGSFELRGEIVELFQKNNGFFNWSKDFQHYIDENSTMLSIKTAIYKLKFAVNVRKMCKICQKWLYRSIGPVGRLLTPITCPYLTWNLFFEWFCNDSNICSKKNHTIVHWVTSVPFVLF